MTKTSQTYREMKAQLDTIMEWFEQDDIDIDEALQKFAEAEKTIASLETYLADVQQKIEKMKAE